MSTRVTWAMVLVSALSALLLALASSVTARLLWGARERRDLAAAADSVAAAIEREGQGPGRPKSPMDAAKEAVSESTLPGYGVEVWDGDQLVTSIPAAGGSALASASGRGRSLRHTRPLPGGLTLILSEPPDASARALRLFVVSLVVAAPICLGVAVVVSTAVARHATRPLRDLQQRIGSLAGLEPLPPSDVPEVPLEVAELEAAFRALWERVVALARRESEFAANASHELRTPLTRMRLNAERALADAGPIARAALSSQTRELDRLARLVDALLVLARDVSAGTAAETVNFADVCRRVAERAFKGDARVDAAFPDEALVRGDEALLEVATENLLDNARKFAVGSEPVRAELTAKGGAFHLSVTTPGARISREARERLFDRFYRDPLERSRADGHGLGLALARHIARLHGGDVSCVSSDAEDARFVLEIPLWTAAPPSSGVNDARS